MMSLPMSQYEDLLAQMRGLRRQAQQVQQLANPLLEDIPILQNEVKTSFQNPNMDSSVTNRQLGSNSKCFETRADNHTDGEHHQCSEDEGGSAHSTHLSVSSEPISHKRDMSVLYRGTWPVERVMWNSEPTNLGPQQRPTNQMDGNSVMSFASSSGGVPLDRVLGSPDTSRRSSQQLEAKVDMVYSLLAMLGGQEHADMGETLLALSTNPESCLAMRQSGCIPLLVKLVQSDKDAETRKKAAKALHNLVHSQPDDKLRKREVRIFKLLEHIRAYTEALETNTDFVHEISSVSSSDTSGATDDEKHPVQTIAHIMKLSFDEGHRQAICQLGGIDTIAILVETEHSVHGSTSDDTHCILMRRYACMALTNLTFGDSGNKALLCSFKRFIKALVVQLLSPSDELRQVTASLLRNLSWRADSTSKEILKEVGCVTGLMKSAMLDNKENTLKSILSALWNLSAHCTENKSEICSVDGALQFLVAMLSYKAPSKSLAIIENAGGILRNISSQIAVRDDFREILRRHNCLQVLLMQLKSPSLTIVSNACGTLWNLSAKNTTDQELLWQLGAPTMLRSLNHSKHKMIAMGSSAALKNLLNARPSQGFLPMLDSTAMAMDLPALPTLGARKQKALLKDLDQSLSETFENIERDSPLKEKSITNRPPSIAPREFVTHGDDSFTNSFASLNINEPSTSFDGIKKSRIPQSCESASLPYVKPSAKPRSYIAVRSKFADDYEDEETNEEPYDFSQKYSETKLPKQVPPKSKSSSGEKYKYTKVKEENQSFGIYAETDLDQPTDYSLRYAENDSESDICSNISQEQQNEYVQDSVKTYYTEGTPYETPFNYSTATSMSDLRVVDEKVIDNDQKVKEEKFKEVVQIHDEKDRCSTEDISETDPPQPSASTGKIPKSQFSSGLMSPEKPVNYCDEGTPGYFSRVSSFGSLNSIPQNDAKVVKNEPPVKQEVKAVENKVITESAKAVKFENNVNYAEETPLMFSRSSSLASLDSIEQHSIHDDRSSVISDFSRLTSGIVSPSELPDSPSQTVPQSPKPRKNGSMVFPTTYTASSGNNRAAASNSANIPKSSVFEDNTTKFKEESTPMQFSSATSLSSLTIDDHEEPQARANQLQLLPQLSEDQLGEKDDEKQDIGKEKSSNASEDLNQVSDDEGDDDDILAACINDGMQNMRHNQTSTSTNNFSLSNFKYEPKPSFTRTGSGIPMSRVPSRNIPVPNTPNTPKSTVNNDTVHTYYTENTPAILSHAGSNSDLSVLSLNTDVKSRKDYLSDDSSNLSGDNDNILAECIQSGMPKAKKETLHSGRSTSVVSALPRRSLPSSTPIKYNPSNATTSNLRRGSLTEANQVPNKDLQKKLDVSLLPCLVAVDEINSFAVENSPQQFSLRSSLSDLTVDSCVAGLKKCPPSNHLEPSAYCSPDTSGTHRDVSGADSRQLSRHESLSSISIESVGSLETEQALLEQCISSGMPKSKHNVTPNKVELGKENMEAKELRRSKNGNVASVARSTNQRRTASPKAMDVAADVEKSRNIENVIPPNKEIVHQINMPPEKYSQSDATPLTNLTKSGSKPIDNVPKPIKGTSTSTNQLLDSRLERSCNESQHNLDMRMLDPDAMIESLDRFTAELVSQASTHLQNKDSYKLTASDNTWNEDENEISFPSVSGSAPNVVTFDDTSNRPGECNDIVDTPNEPSNDFSSLTTSTMTQSTLIAMEATKVAFAFKKEADMSNSMNSTASLELDQVLPPSHLNSLTNSAVGLELPRSPRLISRKKSLPRNLMVKRALNKSLTHTSSLDSVTNLDNINPPSMIADVMDMEGSTNSIPSITSEIHEVKANFLINGEVNKELRKGACGKQPLSMMNLLANGNSVSDIDNMNPPSLFNEITDMCNSLADVASSAIGSETEVFEDCVTHIVDTFQTENDVTEFSDANSITPIQSDGTSSSTESTPKRTSKSIKERRMSAKERYKTYTVDAETIQDANTPMGNVAEADSTSDDFKTVDCFSDDYASVCDTTYVTPTYKAKNKTRLTPKERRQSDKARFQTQVVERSALQRSSSTETPTPVPETRLNQRRLSQNRTLNKDRYQTQTIPHPSITAQVHNATLSPPPEICNPEELHVMLEKGASKVLKTLNEVKHYDELLECETLSLVSNDDDSEHNSGSSMNYRTYHKSWGCRKNTVVIAPKQEAADLVNYANNLTNGLSTSHCSEHSDEENEATTPAKPKIVKPTEKREVEEATPEAESPKAIRGRRKALYSKTNLIQRNVKPIKVMTSNLVRNVSSSLRSSPKITETKIVSKPPVPQQSRASSGYGSRPTSSGNSSTSPLKKPALRTKTPPNVKAVPQLERQGTFTKDDSSPSAVKSKIPGPSTKIPTFGSKLKSPSKINTHVNNIQARNGDVKPTNGGSRISKIYNRSTSADSRDGGVYARSIQSSSSSHSLRSEPGRAQSGAIKKSPSAAQRSSSNSSLNSNGSSTKKQVTSKIASLWKKIEDTKKQTLKADKNKVWIEAQPPTTQLTRSNTFNSEK